MTGPGCRNPSQGSDFLAGDSCMGKDWKEIHCKKCSNSFPRILDVENHLCEVLF